MIQLINWTKRNGERFAWNVFYLAVCLVIYNVVINNGQLKTELTHVAELCLAVTFGGFFLFFALDTMTHFARSIQSVDELIKTITASKISRYLIDYFRFAMVFFLYRYFDGADMSGVGLLFMGTCFFLLGFLAHYQYSREINR